MARTSRERVRHDRARRAGAASVVPRRDERVMTRTARLSDITLPDFGMPEAAPEIPAAIYRDRIERLRARADEHGYDHLLVYADREHSANLAYLTGFDPRFEEALLVRGRVRRPRDPGRQRVLSARREPRRSPCGVTSSRTSACRASREIAPGRSPRSWRTRVSGSGHRIGVDRLEGVRRPRADRGARVPRRRGARHGRVRHRRERGLPLDRRGRRPSRDQRGRTAGGVRTRGVPDLERCPEPDLRAAPRPSRRPGRAVARMERDTALVSPDADERRPCVLGLLSPRDRRDRARRPLHGRVRDLGSAQLPRRIRGRGRLGAPRTESATTSDGSSARTSGPWPNGTGRCTSARPVARCTRSSSGTSVTRSSASS